MVLLSIIGVAVVLLGGTDSDTATPVAAESSEPAPSEPPSAGPSEPSEPSEPTEPTAPTAPTEPPFPANTEPDTEDPAGMGTITSLHISPEPGFDEIAFVVDGPGVGWLVEYVEEPRRQGSGDPVDIQGDTVLKVVLRPLEQPQDTAGRIPLTETAAMVELVDGGWFEGQQEFFVGLEGPQRPFRMIPDDDGGALLQVDTTRTG